MYIYNESETIRSDSQVEKIYSTHKGFIGRLENVQYKQSDGSWKDKGSRWLISETDPRVIMDYGFKGASL